MIPEFRNAIRPQARISRSVAVVLGVFFLVGSTPLPFGQEASGPSKLFGPGDHTFTLKVGNLDRHYSVHTSPSYTGRTPVPVVIMLHGAGGTSEGAMRQTGWTNKSDAAGFLAAFPEAMCPDPSRPPRFRNNPQVWNDGRPRGYAFRQNFDDVGFINALLDDLIVRFAIDQQRIYVTGFSNGASMAFRIGAELSSRIAAVAPVAGHLFLENTELDRPVPLIYMIGTEDALNRLEGTAGEHSDKRGPQPPVPQSVLKWAGLLHCKPKPRVFYDKDGVTGAVFSHCQKKAEAVFYKIEGMGHTWPGGKSRLPEWMVGETTDKLKATEVIWEFFEKHPKQ